MGSRKGVREGGGAGAGRAPEGDGLRLGRGLPRSPRHPLRLSHSHFPNSPVLPGCQGNRSCQARSPRKPRARLSPRPIPGCPPHPAARCGGWEGQWRGGGGGQRTRTGSRTCTRVPQPKPHPHTRSWVRNDRGTRTPSPAGPHDAATPQHRTRQAPRHPSPRCAALRPLPLSSATAPSPGGLGPGPLIRERPPPVPPTVPPPAPTERPSASTHSEERAPSGGQHARPAGGGPPQ